MSGPPHAGQDEFWRAEEGDRYYSRNRDTLKAKQADTDPAIGLVRTHALRPDHVLELGCADGWRLELLRRELGCHAVGVDASEGAIRAGRADYPELELHVGTLADVPIETRRFDLVIVYFVFHWNARETLLRACSEVDRLVADGGHLIVGDFLPDRPVRRVYHHAADAGVYTYKQDYAALFSASALYEPVERVIFDATSKDSRRDPDVPADDRGGCTLLRKSLTAGWPVSG
jgi:SAM-dependent methyltransferase